jgi:hypothetical protein
MASKSACEERKAKIADPSISRVVVMISRCPCSCQYRIGPYGLARLAEGKFGVHTICSEKPFTIGSAIPTKSQSLWWRRI